MGEQQSLELGRRHLHGMSQPHFSETRKAGTAVNSWLPGLAAYLEALELDELLDAVDDEDLLVVVDVADVAGVEPAVDVDRPRGGLRVVQVPCAGIGIGRSLVAHGGASKLLAERAHLPFMIWGPRMQISPGRLRPSERPVSGSTTLSSALRTTVPHDPGLAGDGSLANAGHMDSTGPASVIPYPCSQITSGSSKIPGKTELGFAAPDRGDGFVRVAVPSWVVPWW